jgi:hypothetical protein
MAVSYYETTLATHPAARNLITALPSPAPDRSQGG